MITNHRCLLTLVFGVVAASFGVVGWATARDITSFRAFWSEFRTAALADDLSAMTTMTSLPLVIEDSLDEETRLQDAAAVMELFPHLLDQDVGLSAEPQSMRDYVRKHAEAAPSDLEPSGARARIGQFEFEFVDGRWLLTRAYLE